MNDLKLQLPPERIGWGGVCAILSCSLMTAKRLLLVDPAFPRPFRVAPKLVTFDPTAVRAYVALREQEPLEITSIRGAAAEATHAVRKAKRVAAQVKQPQPTTKTHNTRPAKAA